MMLKLALIRIGKFVFRTVENSPDLARKLWHECCDIVKQIRAK